MPRDYPWFCVPGTTFWGSNLGVHTSKSLALIARVRLCVFCSIGPVYHEYCVCPEEDPQTWQKTLACPISEPQIEKDFASFPSINLQQMLNEVPTRFGGERGAVVHYTILNNRIYRRNLGKYTDFKMFSDEILLSLARKVWKWFFWLKNLFCYTV